MMTAIEMLRNHSLNPHWFGHPGTITLYCLALVSLAVGGIGIATGRYADTDAFVSAVYADPANIVPPRPAVHRRLRCVLRLSHLAAGPADRRGRHRPDRRGVPRGERRAYRLFAGHPHRYPGQRLHAALPAHARSRSSSDGRLRDYLLAGVFVGLGCATKWPAATIAAEPHRRSGYGASRTGTREVTRRLDSVRRRGSCYAVSWPRPYLLLDYPAVVRDLAGEARPRTPAPPAAACSPISAGM
jgi:hypothetical protein